VISPQCPAGEWWLNEPLHEVMSEVLDTYRIDRSRMYMTGLSMGGFGTWSFASQYPELFAAIAPISGGGDALHWSGLRTYTQLDVPPATLENLKEMPVWVFHGDSDTVVSIGEDQKTVDALKALGGAVEFTVYPNVGHDAWTQTYNNPELYKWFLNHTKQTSPSAVKNWNKSE
jgi:predicted peptidase